MDDFRLFHSVCALFRQRLSQVEKQGIWAHHHPGNRSGSIEEADYRRKHHHRRAFDRYRHHRRSCFCKNILYDRRLYSGNGRFAIVSALESDGPYIRLLSCAVYSAVAIYGCYLLNQKPLSADQRTGKIKPEPKPSIIRSSASAASLRATGLYCSPTSIFPKPSRS